MATKQGYLKEKGSQDKLAPKTLDSLVKDSARNRALSASLQELAERQCLGYPPFATTQNYTVGDKVFYDRKLWKFTSSHAAGAWNASHVTAWSVEDEVSELKLAVTALDERKANIDGFYEGMGVGVAKRLEGNTDVAGSFLERTTGGDAELANGLAQLNEVQGGSVKFNQLVDFSSFIPNSSSRVTLSNAQNGDVTVTSINDEGIDKYAQKGYKGIKGHRLFVRCKYKAGQTTESTGVGVLLFFGSWNDCSFTTIKINDTDWHTYSKLFTGGVNDTNMIGFGMNKNSGVPSGSTVQFKDTVVIDLTAIFGEGNEPSTVAEFESWLAENVGVKDYYDYTEGEVVNNNMTGIESTGFNLFNPTTGKARIIGAYSDVYGNYYGIRGTYGTLTFEDDLGNVSTVTPDADGKLEFNVSGYISVADAGNDVAVFLWWDGKKTEYEDYDVEIAHLDVKHIYGKKNGTGELVQVWPTGMPKINDVVDKLCIENGAVVAKRAIQEVDLGDLTWGNSTYGCYATPLSNPSLPAPKGVSISEIACCICSKYKAVTYSYLFNHGRNQDNIAIYEDGTIVVSLPDDITTPASSKTYLAGILFYYELVTPETYTDLVYMGSEYFDDGTPVTLPVNYKVNNWGVESILPKNTSTILTAKPTIKVRYAIDAVEQLNTHSDEIESLHDDIDELDGAKANTVGVYDDMVVGAAKAIAGNQRLDKEFTSMVVDGADGVAKINEVRGKSLVWNQLWTNGNTQKSVSFNEQYAYITITQTFARLIATHKYYVACDLDCSNLSDSDFKDLRLILSTEGHANYLQITHSSPKVGRHSFIATAEYTQSTDIKFIAERNTAGGTETVSCKNTILFDLTQMFGAGNEPATVEEFEALFPDAYYDYNAGAIINNATEELDVTGFNQWDEEWEVGRINANGENVAESSTIRSKNYIPILPNTTYYFKSSSVYGGCFFFYYDANKNFVTGSISLARNNTFTTPEGVRYLRFYEGSSYGITYNYDICINISDASRNGTYEPYKHGVVPLNLSTITGKQVGVEGAESEVIFPDGMRQAGSVADTLLVDDDGYARRALVKVGSRAYQSGDESDSTVVTDLTNTLYALATPLEYTLDEPILMTFKAYHGGTIVQSPQAPDSAPMSMNVTFALDAVGALNNLPKNYISADSMDAFLAQLGTAMNGTWTKSWDASNNRYGFTFTPNTEGE